MCIQITKVTVSPFLTDLSLCRPRVDNVGDATYADTTGITTLEHQCASIDIRNEVAGSNVFFYC